MYKVILLLTGLSVSISQVIDDNKVSDIGPMIIGGTQAAAGQFPFTVSIRRNNTHICGGTLISSWSVVTAARCFYDQTILGLTVVAGTNKLDAGGVSREVAAIKRHPDFHETFLYNDIAILNLKIPYLIDVILNPNIKLATLSSYGNPITRATLIGWGWTSYNSGAMSNDLKYLDTYTIYKQTCGQYDLRHDFNFEGGQFCTKNNESSGGCESEQEEELINVPERDKVRRPIFIVGSFVWTMYTCTCCAVYFVHFFRQEKLCAMLVKWQILEGELISESKAIKATEESVESFLKRQRNGLITFLLGFPFSFAFLGAGTTYYKRFPMNMFSNFATGLEHDRSWIEPVCFIISWIQVGIFLLCECQTELIALAFTRSMSSCLKILSKPATDFHSRYMESKLNPKQSQNDVCHILATEKAQLIEIFHDSVTRYEHLKSLIDDFNAIFCWPLFTRKAFTMAKVCCYVYLLLRRPKDSGFPTATVFFYAPIAIFTKFGVILNSMGEVQRETKNFVKEWRKVLLLVCPRKAEVVEEERMLNCCFPFGFKMGNFYTVNPQTLLTFCSVVLTYLIILLQLQLF